MKNRRVPEHYQPGLLRIDPSELCDPYFATLNAEIQAGESRNSAYRSQHTGEWKQRRLEGTARRMRRTNQASINRRSGAFRGWETRRARYLQNAGRSDA